MPMWPDSTNTQRLGWDINYESSDSKAKTLFNVDIGIWEARKNVGILFSHHFRGNVSRSGKKYGHIPCY